MTEVGVNEVDNTLFEDLLDAIVENIKLFGECFSQDILSGPRHEKFLTVIGNLLDSNPTLITHDDSCMFHEACKCLTGKLGISEHVISYL